MLRFRYGDNCSCLWAKVLCVSWRHSLPFLHFPVINPSVEFTVIRCTVPPKRLHSWTGDTAQRTECWPTVLKALGLIPRAGQTLGLAPQTCGMCWHTSVIIALERSRWTDQKFKVILFSIASWKPAWATWDLKKKKKYILSHHCAKMKSQQLKLRPVSSCLLPNS